jgi:hypothetical protein
MSATLPSYTFVSVSTAKPGRLDDLLRVACAPSESMDGLPGLIARQVGVDRERNAVVVWVTFDAKETLQDFLATPEGQQQHVGDEPLDAIIDTFAMYDLTPVSGRLPG